MQSLDGEMHTARSKLWLHARQFTLIMPPEGYGEGGLLALLQSIQLSRHGLSVWDYFFIAKTFFTMCC